MKLPQLSDCQFSVDDGVALLCFDRDDVRNVLTDTGIPDDLNRICDWINRHQDVGALVVTGNGKAFSAGGNIKKMQNKTGMFSGDGLAIQDNYRRGIQQMVQNLYRVEVPVIAAVNGPAIGAGLDLCCMCDIRLCSDRARFGETFVNLGIIPGDGGAWFLPRVVGPQRAAELTFAGRVIDAQQALDYGLVLDVTSAEKLRETALTMAAGFAEKPRRALRISKRLLHMGQRMPLEDFLDYCASQQSLCHGSAEHQTAVDQVLSKLSN